MKKVLVAMLFAVLQIATCQAYAAGSKPNVNKETDLAAQAYQAGDYRQAIEHFNKVIKLAPNDVMAWHFLGQSLAKTGEVMGARRAYGRVLELQPEGQVANRTRELLAKLPEPDLFKIQLDSGLTLGDWLPTAQQQAAQGKREAVLREIAQRLKQIGPVPQLLALQGKLNKEVLAEQEQRIKSSVDTLEVNDADSAKTALPQIRQLRTQAPNNLTLLQFEAKACHLLLNFTCAEAAYAAWLKGIDKDDPERQKVITWLIQSKSRQPVSLEDQMLWKETARLIRDENFAWQESQKNGYSAIESYIKKYPTGRYIGPAKEKLNLLYQEMVGKRPLPNAVPIAIRRTLITSPLFASLPDSPTIKCDQTIDNYILHPVRKGYERRDRSQSGVATFSVWWESTSYAGEVNDSGLDTLGGLLNIRYKGVEITNIEDSSGVMFPLQTGNKFNVVYSNSDGSKKQLSCEIFNAIGEIKDQPGLPNSGFYRVACEGDDHYRLCSNAQGSCLLSWPKSLGETPPDFARGFGDHRYTRRCSSQ